VTIPTQTVRTCLAEMPKLKEPENIMSETKKILNVVSAFIIRLMIMTTIIIIIIIIICNNNNRGPG